MDSVNFAILGVGGYIAPRHLKAIKETNNNLIAAVDPKDSVGIIDSFFSDVEFFKEFESFDRYAEKLKRMDSGKEIHWVSVCSPNYLHDSHIFSALRLGANVICEKPLVLTVSSLDALQDMEKEVNKGKINTVLQLRYHPTIQELKNTVDNEAKDKKYDVDLTYITPRGKWYFESWKGDQEKSGGIATNIGVHFFDMLIWIFGKVINQSVHLSTPSKMAGHIELEKARVRWFLSIDKNDLPDEYKDGNKAYRSLVLNGKEFEFSDGFTNLHEEVYRHALAGEGFGCDAVRPSIELVENIRNSIVENIRPSIDAVHPFLKNKKYSVSAR